MKIKSRVYRYALRHESLSRLMKFLGEKIFFRDVFNILLYPFFYCNYKCPYCIIRKSNFKFKEHSALEWANAFNKLKRSVISISGGEPFLWKNNGMKVFLENIDKKHAIYLVTNLYWKIEDHLSYLKEANERLSLFIAPSFHPHMTDVNIFLKKMKILRDNGFFISSSLVAYPTFFPKLKYYKKKFNDAGISLGIYSYIHPEFRYSDKQRKLLEQVTKKHVRGSITDFDSNPKKKICRAGKTNFLFVPSGDCYICHSGFYCVNSEIYKKYKAKKSEFFIGNIFDGTFKPKKGMTICDKPCSEICDIVCAKPKVIG